MSGICVLQLPVQGSVEDRWAQVQAERAEDEALKQAEAEALTKKQRIALQVGFGRMSMCVVRWGG